MKNKRALLFLLFVNLFLSSLYGQGKIIDQVKIRADNGDKERFDRIAIDIKTDHWFKTPPGINTKLYSIGISAFLYKDIPLSKKSNFSIAYGIGLSSDNIHHNGNFIVTTNNSYHKQYTELTPYNGLKPRINKITLNYIEMPFEIRFRTMNNSLEERRRFNFRFYPGFKIGYLMGTHAKLVTDQTKIKVYRTPNTLSYRYGPTLRVGFNKVSFVAFYSLTGIFEEGKGSELNTFSIGISWMRF